VTTAAVRRFWPVACGRIDIDRFARDRDQLWAEAKARFERGCVWWLETTELVGMASLERADRYEGDPREEVIARWTLWTQVDKNRVARCFRALGWERYRERQGARLEWRYRRIEP
jgi:predicted P-loop ATPase